LTVHRSAFVPNDLPLGIAAPAGGWRDSCSRLVPLKLRRRGRRRFGCVDHRVLERRPLVGRHDHPQRDDAAHPPLTKPSVKRSILARGFVASGNVTARAIAFHQIGDAVAPRRASLAFYEGRELARRL